MRERDVEVYLTGRAVARGGEVRKLGWIGRRGAPDRVLLMPGGVTVWVEVKAPGAKPQPHQAREHARLRRNGHAVAVLDSREAVDQFFDEVIV
jgi:hypothetical protein